MLVELEQVNSPHPCRPMVSWGVGHDPDGDAGARRQAQEVVGFVGTFARGAKPDGWAGVGGPE